MADDAQGWVREHGADLVGLPEQEAADAVTAAGLHPRTARGGEALTLAFRPDRVTLLLDADGRVTGVGAG